MNHPVINTLLVILSLLPANHFAPQDKGTFNKVPLGTRALGNAAWLMSEADVSRANQINLLTLKNNIISNSSTECAKFLKVKEVKDVSFYNSKFDLSYFFLNDKLVKCVLYKCFITPGELATRDSAFVRFLSQEYGDTSPSRITPPRTTWLWETNDLSVTYCSRKYTILYDTWDREHGTMPMFFVYLSWTCRAYRDSLAKYSCDALPCHP